MKISEVNIETVDIYDPVQGGLQTRNMVFFRYRTSSGREGTFNVDITDCLHTHANTAGAKEFYTAVVNEDFYRSER